MGNRMSDRLIVVLFLVSCICAGIGGFLLRPLFDDLSKDKAVSGRVTGTVETDPGVPLIIRGFDTVEVTRHITNAGVVTQVVTLYREFTNFVTAPPVRTRQTLERVEFDIYKNRYILPLSFPRWQVGIGYDILNGAINIHAGYRFWDRWGVTASVGINRVEIAINVFID